MQSVISVSVNGKMHEVEVDTRMLLADMLRDVFRLTGTHIGCATGNCGACTVTLDGRTVKSCCILAVDVAGHEIETIESVAPEGSALHPIQQAFVDHQGLQCGYCTPGMIMSTRQLLAENQDPNPDEIRHAISGNLCRCTGYQFIIESIQAAAEQMRTAR